MADAAWSILQEIERAGGMGAALTSGIIAEKIKAVAAERARNLARRKDPITGVSEFPDIGEARVDADHPDLPAILAKRDQAPVGAVDALPAPGTGALMTTLVTAVSKGANVLAMSKALGGAPISSTPLRAFRLAETFEALRDKGEAAKGRAKIYLATIGTAAEFTPRLTFAKNFFEAGGIAAIAGENFTSSGAALAVICSTDALYKEKAASAAAALKAAGAKAVYLAGRGGEIEAALKAAGIDDFIYIGCDAAAVLTAAYARLEGAAP